MSLPPTPLPKRWNAFTLVEIVLSLGIISFAFVGVLGMLPVGLDVSRRAIDTTIVAQIAQQLTTEAQQTDFSRLEALEAASKATPYWFDYQGNQTTDPAAQIYKATVDVSTSTHLPSSTVTNRLATVKVCVLNTRSGRTDNVAEPELSRDSRNFVVLIPDNGR